MPSGHPWLLTTGSPCIKGEGGVFCHCVSIKNRFSVTSKKHEASIKYGLSKTKAIHWARHGWTGSSDGLGLLVVSLCALFQLREHQFREFRNVRIPVTRVHMEAIRLEEQSLRGGVTKAASLRIHERWPLSTSVPGQLLCLEESVVRGLTFVWRFVLPTASAALRALNKGPERFEFTSLWDEMCHHCSFLVSGQMSARTKPSGTVTRRMGFWGLHGLCRAPDPARALPSGGQPWAAGPQQV